MKRSIDGDSFQHKEMAMESTDQVPAKDTEKLKLILLRRSFAAPQQKA
jgi:hypothetical protein